MTTAGIKSAIGEHKDIVAAHLTIAAIQLVADSKLTDEQAAGKAIHLYTLNSC